jgi:hypothetical protein
MTDVEALTILEDAHRRCGTEDMRTPEVVAALDALEALAADRSAETWPCDQFRRALGSPGDPFTVDHAGRGQILNASINGIRRVCQIRTPRR